MQNSDVRSRKRILLFGDSILSMSISFPLIKKIERRREKGRERERAKESMEDGNVTRSRYVNKVIISLLSRYMKLTLI